MQTMVVAIALAGFPLAALSGDLQALLGESLRLAGSSRNASVAYCPDNTCEVFTLRGKNARLDLERFAALYFYRVSEYVYLNPFQAQEPPGFVALMLASYREVCPQANARAAAKCAASHIAARRRIKGQFVRHDEGRRTATPFSPAKVIGEALHGI